MRKELYLAVPSYFKCPISKDVMKSPVCLCTGVTYDRSSIQHWLDAGHDTCPATNQPLPTKDFVPNLTLHRIIHLWSDQPPSPSAMSQQQLKALIDNIPNDQSDSLLKIFEFANKREENRRMLVNIDGFLRVIVGLFSSIDDIKVLELVVKVLDLILIENGVKEQLQRLIFNCDHDFLSSIALILHQGSLISKIQSVRVLESISLNTESKRRIAERENLISSLIHLLDSEPDPALHDVVLSFLPTVSVNRSIKIQLVQLKLIPVLSKLISNAKSTAPVTEKCIKLILQVSSFAEGRSAISDDRRCTAALVEKLMKVSRTATEDVVAVLWSMCCVYRDEKVVETMVNSNGVTKILLVMQSDCEDNVRRMCGDLVRVLRIGNKICGLVSYETNTSHIMPY